MLVDTVNGPATGVIIVDQNGGSASSGVWADSSGSIASDGQSQVVYAAGGATSYLFLQNISGDDLWFNFGTPAVLDSPSMLLAPNGTYEPRFIHSGSLNVIGATSGQKYICKRK